MKIAAVAASPGIRRHAGARRRADGDGGAGRGQVVKLDNAVAVVADNYWAAQAGPRGAAPQWDAGPNAELSRRRRRRCTRQRLEARRRGRAQGRRCQAALSGARRASRQRVYEEPFLAHATMEPMNCTVHVTPDGCDIWVGTQIPTSRAGRPSPRSPASRRSKVRIHNHLLGGGFGRRLEVDFVVQAVQIAKQVDEPVKVDLEPRGGHPARHVPAVLLRSHQRRRSTRPAGRSHGTHRIVGSSIMARFAPPLIKDGVDRDAVDGAIDLAYDIPNFHVDYVREEPPGIPTAFWRGVGPTRNASSWRASSTSWRLQAKQDPSRSAARCSASRPRARTCSSAPRSSPAGARRCRPAQGRGIALHEGVRQLSSRRWPR